MPKVSKKSKALNLFIEKAVQDLILLEDSDSGTYSSEQEIWDELVESIFVTHSFRYMSPFTPVPKTRTFINDILFNLDEDRFCQIVRVKRAMYHKILNLIEDDEVFKGHNSWKQFPCAIQLVIALYRLGCSGEGASIAHIANFFGVSDGGTVTVITRRVFTAIMKLKDKFLFWPDEKERTAMVVETFHELPQCIGYVDSSEIKLAEKPTEDPEAYYSRKSQYSIKMQVICDHKLRILHVVIGYPGSVHDSRIYQKCSLSANPEKFFSDSQWLAGDSAYKLTTTVLTPYRSNSTQLTLKELNDFNRTFSKYRVRIENTFALLKERFSSLKELKINVRNASSKKFACQWILTCCILHNIIASFGANDIQELLFEEEARDDGVIENEDTGEGEIKRKALWELIKTNIHEQN